MPVDLTVPPWLLERCQFWAAQLGLQDWEIEITLSTAPDGDIGNLGLAETSPDRSFATITLRADVEESPRWEIYLVHELLHVKHSAIDAVVQTVISPPTGEGKAMADAAYRRVVEPYIHSMARALVILDRREYQQLYSL